MSATIIQTKEKRSLRLDCKQCHCQVSDEETVAYHLIDQVLYGWCQPCYARREAIPKTSREVTL